ncbi:MAG: carboxypeptidase-like regulatory domain-containing protein [Calditrichia bacterium]
MLNSKNLRIFAGFLLAALLFNCAPEAPHSNPLDPYNKANSASGILLEGRVMEKNQPHLPLDSCMVILSPEQKFTSTDAAGSFSFDNLTPGEYQLVIQRHGYASDTTRFATDTLKSDPLNFYLNGNPFLIRSQFFSEFIDQWWPDPFFLVKFGAIFDDPDGAADISDVTFTMPDAGITKVFEKTARPDSFFVQLDATDFPDNNVFEMVGKGAQIIARDKSGAVTSSGPFYLYRIIDTSPAPLQPAGMDTASARPLLHWESYRASFAFTYEISMFFVNAGIPVLIHSRKAISSGETEYQYPDSLAAGQYFWTIGVRDNLGNFSRSKEASFLVQ